MTQQIELDGHSLITPEAIDAEFESATGSSQRHSALTDLDRAAREFEEGREPAEIGAWVTMLLHETRAGLATEEWRALIPLIQTHPVASYFLQDPLTRWSWDKPRGYSGDAHLLDLIYRHPKTSSEVENATPLGKALFEFTSHAPSSLANCDRRDILANLVDETARRKVEGAEILSFAAGHLREAERSKALADGTIARWVAVDQDPLSIAEIRDSFGGTAVEAVNGSARDLLGKRLDLGTFDLVYASGIYDYLTDKVAVKLTQRLLELVRPGGTFLFANYSRPIIVDGYLETFMNWTLLLRTEEDMLRIISDAAPADEWEHETFFGHERNIVYARLSRRS